MLLFRKGLVILLSDGSTITHDLVRKKDVFGVKMQSISSPGYFPHTITFLFVPDLHTNPAKLSLSQLRGAKVKYCPVETLKGTLDLFLMSHF